MKHAFRIVSNLIVLLHIFSISYAMDDQNVFRYDLGISLDGDYSNDDLLRMDNGSSIQGIVVDPAKIGGCDPGDKVEVTKNESDIWQIRHLKTGQFVIAKTIFKKDSLKIKKIGPPNSLSSNANPTKSNNVMIKLGAYIPNNDIEDMDTGFYSEVTYNRYLNKNLALEIGGGSFFTSGKAQFEDAYGNQRTVSGDLYGYNFIMNLKAVYPIEFGEIYAGVGPGMYLVYGDEDGTDVYVDDDDTVFGGQAVAGFNFDVNEIVFLGFEGQYIFTADAEFGNGGYSKKFNLNGYNLSGVLGFRF